MTTPVTPQMAFTVMNWNLQNFGQYTGGIDWMASAIVEAKADIVLVEEMIVNRKKSKGMPKVIIDNFPPQDQAIGLAKHLLACLKVYDKGGGWKIEHTNASCSNADRDAYLFLYRSTPKGSGNQLDVSHTAYAIPDSISVSAIGIYQEGADGSKKRKLGFKGSRRPGGGLFALTSGTTQKTCLTFAFHALAPDRKEREIQHSIQDAITAAGTTKKQQSADALVIGGDFNLDYVTNDSFYNHLTYDIDRGSNPQTMNVAITQNGYSSLLTKVDEKDPAKPVYKTTHAYDNILFNGAIGVMPGTTPYIRDVIGNYAEFLRSKDSSLSLLDATRQAFGKYRTQYGGCVSDHLPAVATFVI